MRSFLELAYIYLGAAAFIIEVQGFFLYDESYKYDPIGTEGFKKNQKMSNPARNCNKNSVVFGGCGGSAAVSSQLHFVHTY